MMKFNEDWEEDEPIDSKYLDIEKYIPYKFKQFLLDNNCYNEYCDNLLNCRSNKGFTKKWNTIEDFFEKNYINSTPNGYISDAFRWADTIQDHEYWLIIARMYNKTISKFERFEFKEDWEEDEPISGDFDIIDGLIKSSLKNYLIYKNCYKEFVFNVINSCDTDDFDKTWDYYVDLLYNSDPEVIMNSFSWSYSPEGSDFWDDIYNSINGF